MSACQRTFGRSRYTADIVKSNTGERLNGRRSYTPSSPIGERSRRLSSVLPSLKHSIIASDCRRSSRSDLSRINAGSRPLRVCTCIYMRGACVHVYVHVRDYFNRTWVTATVSSTFRTQWCHPPGTKMVSPGLWTHRTRIVTISLSLQTC